MNWDDSKVSAGRRSRIEMVCDVLRVVSQGAERPTRIMQLANLTWNDLLMYLEVLLRNQLLTREEQGSRTTYRLTEKGGSILELYLKLRQEILTLHLDTLTNDTVSKALKATTLGTKDTALLSALTKRLEDSDFKILDNRVVGKSGETHTFSIVAEAKDGSRHGYVILSEIDEQQVLGLFVNQLDTDLHIHAYSKKDVPPDARKLADSYSINLSRWEDLEGEALHSSHLLAATAAPPRAADTTAYDGKAILLEVDPSINYEKIVGMFASQHASSGAEVFAFTWRGSPVYETLRGVPGVHFYTMSTMVSYVKKGDEPNEMFVPQNDPAVVLDELGKIVKVHSKDRVLILYDSLSDLVVTFGFERSYEFLKNVNEFALGPNITSVYIMKSGAHDERTVNLIKGLYSEHLSYDSSGLSSTRR